MTSASAATSPLLKSLESGGSEEIMVAAGEAVQFRHVTSLVLLEMSTSLVTTLSIL